MITLYQRTQQIFDLAGNPVGWETKPVIFPDTFFLYSGLKFNWEDNNVTRNGKTYYLDKLVVNQDMNIPSIDEWKSHYGNDILFEYYTGDESEVENNPTGSTQNIKRAIYQSSGITKYILEYSYNALNQVIKIASLAPQNSISSGSEQQEEEEIIEYTEQNLNALDFAIGSELIVTNNDTLTLRGNGKCIFVSRRKTSKPLLADGIKTESDTGKINISVSSPLYDVQVIGYNEDGSVVYTSTRVTAVPNTPRTFEIINNYSKNIDFIGINLYYNDDESDIDQTLVTQQNIGLQVAFTQAINLIIRSDGFEDITRHVFVGDQISYASLPTITRDGYDFDGWKIDGNLINDDFIVTANTLVEAVWTRLYTLTKINGEAESTDIYRDGTTINLDSPEKVGHTFLGWSADGVSVVPMSFEIISDLTLTALFSPISVSLTLINGENQDVETYDYGTAITLPTPEKENYQFLGWFADEAESPTASPLTITENTTLTARFEIIRYTITLVNVDGRGLNTEDSITCDSGYSLSENEVKAKLDESLNEFEGCYTDSEMTQAVTFPYTVIGDITFYCKFQEIGG